MTHTDIITDKLGRKIEMKNLSIEDQLDLLEAAQGLAGYKEWFGMATLLFACVSVDGVPLPTPRKPADFKKNAAILQAEGVDAAFKYFKDANENEADKDVVDSIKN